MKITLFGAAGCVTGSAYYVRSKNVIVLVDFGVFQGEKTLENMNRRLQPVNVNTLNAVKIAHSHLDHTDRLPLLTKNGYRGPVYTTEATIDIIQAIYYIIAILPGYGDVITL